MAIAQHSPVFERKVPLRALTGGDAKSDKALVKAAQNGRSEAASQLIERHYPRVLSFVSYLTNRKGQAEDLTQEVFARALTSLQSFNGQYQFEPWLIRIARNLVIDEARKDVHRAAATDPEDLPELEPVDQDADKVWTSMSQQIASSQVKAALAKLPIRQRTALVLREIEEMSYADIAQILGTNIRGVEGTLRRAKARFRLEASAAEGAEGREAVCKRALRLVALNGETPGGEADRHLRICPECRAKSQAIKASDSLFAALPALAASKPVWEGSLVANLVTRPQAVGLKARLYRLFESVRDFGGAQASGPLAGLAQAAAPVLAAGVLSVAGVTGYQQVRQHIAPAQLAAPTFTQEFRADPDKLPVSYVDSQPVSKDATRTAPSRPGSASSSALLVQPPQGIVNSVVDLLSANLPNVEVKQLPLEAQLNLLSELPSPALAKIAETLKLPGVPSDKEALLKVIKEALVKAPSVAPSGTGSTPAPVTDQNLTNAAPKAEAPSAVPAGSPDHS